MLRQSPPASVSICWRGGHLHYIWQQSASQPDAASIENALNAAEMPRMLNIGVLYYRRDLLERYGYGGPPRTWVELEEMAADIQARERAAGATDFWGYLWQGYHVRNTAGRKSPGVCHSEMSRRKSIIFMSTREK